MKKFALLLVLLAIAAMPVTVALGQDEETVVLAQSYDMTSLKELTATLV
jgi:hypothetical protein